MRRPESRGGTDGYPKPSAPMAQVLLAGLLQRLGTRYLDKTMIAAGERLATRITKGDR